MTREIRNGVAVDKATSSSVSFRTYVRHSSCGSTGALASGSSAIVCEVTYTCTTTSCSRLETSSGVYTGTGTKLFSGIDSSNVFSYVAQRRKSDLRRRLPAHPQPERERADHLRRRQPPQRDPHQLIVRTPFSARSERADGEAGLTIVEVRRRRPGAGAGGAGDLRRAQRRHQEHPAGEDDAGGARPRSTGNRGPAQPLPTTNWR